jgi:hypothetical protein
MFLIYQFVSDMAQGGSMDSAGGCVVAHMCEDEKAYKADEIVPRVIAVPASRAINPLRPKTSTRRWTAL